MDPVVLIHGYSSEGATDPADDSPDPGGIYGDLPGHLREMGFEVNQINLGRYISLDDGVGIEDVSLAMERALQSPAHNHLLGSGFSAIVHSTGALVVRNWVRRFGARSVGDGADKTYPCALRRVVYLAGANFGSGWAQIGESLIAKWIRLIMPGHTGRGLAVLDDLELGSSWATDLHVDFLRPESRMLEDYGVMEFCVIGSQPPPSWAVAPIRYGKEEGSDGVVRVCACNLNFNYLRLVPNVAAETFPWEKLKSYHEGLGGEPGGLATFSLGARFDENYYRIDVSSRPGQPYCVGESGGQIREVYGRQYIPFAIPFEIAHSGGNAESAEKGIVTPSTVQVRDLIKDALNRTHDDYEAAVQPFKDATATTMEQARKAHESNLLEKAADWLLHRPIERQGPYDAHAQLVVRVWDQHGDPVNDCSIFFNSAGGGAGAPTGERGEAPDAINKLFEDSHKNHKTPNCMNFYLRVTEWDGKEWADLLSKVNGADLEIEAVDRATKRILYLPLRMRLPADELAKWIVAHQTTVVDVVLMRIPADQTFVMRASG